MGERLFHNVTIHYSMKDHSNPETSLNRVVEGVSDISQVIHQTAKSAILVGMQIDRFIVEIKYEI